ncbi:hypothetical protein QL285_062804 [Trifolium repens]|nr:hypothetical protein QL285_062804 [Trifolium repens]
MRSQLISLVYAYSVISKTVTTLMDMYRSLNNPQGLQWWRSLRGVFDRRSLFWVLKIQGMSLTRSLGAVLYYLQNLKILKFP